MDPITHGLTGAALSLFYSKKQETFNPEDIIRQLAKPDLPAKAVMITVVLSSVIPDLDFICRIAGDFTYFRYHRGPTHSIPGIMLWL